jgi:PhnB protein
MPESSVKGIPEGASVVIPRLFCRDVAAEIDFCKNTFGAVEAIRRPGPDGTAAHAMMTIGPAMIMIEAEWPGLTSRAPKLDGSSPVVIYVYVEDVYKTVQRAMAGGAKVLFPVATQFWGDRIGSVMDPSGHVWTIATRIEETNEGERQGRWSAILAKSDSGTASESF